MTGQHHCVVLQGYKLLGQRHHRLILEGAQRQELLEHPQRAAGEPHQQERLHPLHRDHQQELTWFQQSCAGMPLAACLCVLRSAAYPG